MTANKAVIGPCLICGEDATGKHYGVQPCCAGCKTFFRRAVIQRQDTNCRRPGVCEEERSVRKMCRACRYAKCLEIGMSKEALQPRRDLIGCRRFNQNRRVSNTSNGETNILNDIHTTPPLNDAKPELLKFMQQLTQTDEAIRARKFEMVRSKMEAKKLSELVRQGSWAPEKFSVMLGSDISACTQVEMMTMMEWAQSLPGFTSLPLVDRVTLLKRYAVHHLILEHGYYTANLNVKDVWFISNGSCMPRRVNMLPDDAIRVIPEERKWRQDKLYTEMTDRCIDEVVDPLRRLQLTPEELVTLKTIMLFNCGNHYHIEENTSFLSDETRRMIINFKNRVIAGLFQHYQNIRLKNYEERFGNVILTVSGISSAASAMFESYQVMRLFKITVFDQISEHLLFDAED
jgi:nuclear factor 4